MIRNHAVRIHAYGGRELLRLDELPQPQPAAGEVLVRVLAGSVNPVDWKIRSGYLKAMIPESALPLTLGADFAGSVAALGAGVDRFAVGDAVYGMLGLTGAHAEWICVPAGLLAKQPQSLSASEAASLPLVALTAWQALFEAAQLRSAQSVLIHAGAGGVGSVAIQLARWCGAHVSATASAANADYLRALGASHVHDYRQTPIEAMGGDYDVVLDLVGGETATRSLPLLKPGGVVVVVAGRPGPQAADAQGRRIIGIVVRADGRPLRELATIIDAGHLKPAIAARFALREIADAHALSEQNHTRGKIIVEMDA